MTEGRKNDFQPRDVTSLAKFSDRLNRPVRRYLVYLGHECRTLENVQLPPGSALVGGR